MSHLDPMDLIEIDPEHVSELIDQCVMQIEHHEAEARLWRRIKSAAELFVSGDVVDEMVLIAKAAFDDNRPTT